MQEDPSLTGDERAELDRLRAEVSASFVLFQSDDITRARSAFNLLNTLGVWLPIIALLLIAIGVYVAKSHRRALVGAVSLAALTLVFWGRPTGKVVLLLALLLLVALALIELLSQPPERAASLRGGA